MYQTTKGLSRREGAGSRKSLCSETQGEQWERREWGMGGGEGGRERGAGEADRGVQGFGSCVGDLGFIQTVGNCESLEEAI